MNRGNLTVFTVLFALAFILPVTAAELNGIDLLDMQDRDVVVLSVDGEALVSNLVVHKLRPNRLEVIYEYDGVIPAAPQISGDLITGVEVSPNPGGFMLTLSLSDNVPTEGEAISRETIVASGTTAIEVFGAASNRGAFQTAWLDAPATDVAEVLASMESAPAIEETPVAETPVAVAVGAPEAVSFDSTTNTLMISGVADGGYELKELQFPARVDVVIPGFSANSSNLGEVHRDLSAQVTNIEVVPSRSGGGVVVRSNLGPNMGLVDQRIEGGSLSLTFGEVAGFSAPAAPPANLPAGSDFRSAGSMADSGAAGMDSTDGFRSDNISPSQGGGIGGSLSSAAGGYTPPDYQAPSGFGGQPQAAPSIEQILSMTRQDAYRYGVGGEGEGEAGSYNLPGFEGEDELLSDVRVNLSAAGGLSIYQFLMFLSSISGISIIIDPYWFDDPNGLPQYREPLEPEIPEGEDGGAGFRPANVFDPQIGDSGTVFGNFDNVPFDAALDLVLTTHGLQKVIYKNENDPYAKPIILVTSKERLEQELAGQNEIALYQLHYADPNQIYQILFNLNLLPSITVGWYVYRGGGGQQGGGGQGGGGGGQGGGGGGQGGGGGGQGGANSIDDAAAASGSVRQNYFGDPMQIGGGGGGGGIGGGGGGGGQGGGGGGGQGGGGGGQGNFGIPIPTAKAGLVVMRGTPETLNTVQSLIAKIDRPPKQVAMKVKVYQVSSDPQEVWGLLRATAQDDRLNVGYELGSLAVNVLPKGGVLLDENYTAAFEFLQTERKAKLITETEVAVVDGFTADINNTRTRGQLSGTLVITPDGQVINQPVFNPVTVGTDLSFTPQIDDRGRVTMFVDISLSNFDGPEQVASANGQQVTFQPTVQTDLTTTLRMVDGQTALIGGLATSEDSTTFTGIPFLSKLPIIGQFFGRTAKQRSESFIFITLQTNIIDDK